jgi:tetratricopeptide (TPR) repeat protein
MHRAIAILLVFELGAPIALGQPKPELEPEAQAHLDAGLAAYAAEDFERAVTEFEAAYAIEPDPALLYAWAQAERRSGDCRRARELYHKYIDSQPGPEQIEAARTGLSLCPEPEPEPKPEPDPDPDPGPEAGRAAPTAIPKPPPPVATAPRRERSPWYRDPIGDSLTIAGVAGIGVGVGYLVMARSSQRRADRAEFRDDFAAHLDDVTVRRRIGGVALGVGATLVAAGIARYLLRDDGAVSVAAGAGAISIGGVF